MKEQIVWPAEQDKHVLLYKYDSMKPIICYQHRKDIIMDARKAGHDLHTQLVCITILGPKVDIRLLKEIPALYPE